MLKNNEYARTLRFQSLADLRSAQRMAEERVIFFKIQKDGLAVVPADKVDLFMSLGSINFGITVGKC